MEEMMNNNMQVGFDEDTAPMNFDFDDLDSDQQLLARFVIDDSGSMDQPGESYVDDVRDALEDLTQMIQGSKQEDEMTLGKTLFGDRIKEEPYCLVSDFDTSYSAPGWSTKLYDAVVQSVENVKAAVKKLTDQQFTARGLLVILSDGRDNDSSATKKQATDAIMSLKDTGIDVYFIEFGLAAKGIALSLGVSPDRILTPGNKAMSAEERRKELRAAFRFVSKSAISISQGGVAPSVDNGMFSVD